MRPKKTFMKQQCDVNTDLQWGYCSAQGQLHWGISMGVLSALSCQLQNYHWMERAPAGSPQILKNMLKNEGMVSTLTKYSHTTWA